MSSDKQLLSVGLDIGTTTISAAVVDLLTGRQTAAYTVANDSTIPCQESFRHEQDPNRILRRIWEVLRKIEVNCPSISAIGVTGQMHGMLYVDHEGSAVSPLYTWQDTRAGELFDDKHTYCQELSRQTGMDIQSGYGFATHFYNSCNCLVPEDAVSLCTIMDYVVMQLTGRKTPLIHPSNAASLGLYDLKNGFAETAIPLPGFVWPQVSHGEGLAGYYHGIPVTVAIGDNQASFFGAVPGEEGAVLVNYGTGSQISLRLKEVPTYIPAGMELRPYHSGTYLLCGSALCGGRAYAMLENFFRLYQAAVGAAGGKQYEVMNRLAQEHLQMEDPVTVKTTFCGTRQNPTLRGAITEIGEENFTPGAFVVGVLRGMAGELHEMLLACGVRPEKLIASGNAVRQNPAFQKILAETFGLPLQLPNVKEEAAFGAALFGARFGRTKL